MVIKRNGEFYPLQEKPKRKWMSCIPIWKAQKFEFKELYPELVFSKRNKEWIYQESYNKFTSIELRTQVIGQHVYLYLKEK